MKFVFAICQQCLRFSFLALFFFTPLIFTSFNSELFEFNKMIFVYLVTIIILFCWVIKMLIARKVIFRRTFWDLPLLLFFLSQALSTFFSHDIYMSLFGYYSRFHQGLFSLVAFLILYWAFVSNIRENLSPTESEGQGGYINKLILTIILASSIVSVYGICQHFGLDFFHWVQDVQFRVFSTMGQPNWLGAYLTVVILIAFGAYLNLFQNHVPDENLKSKTKKSKLQLKINKSINLFFIFYSLFFILLYTCLLFTRSRSGFTAFHVAYFILTIILFRKLKKIILVSYLIFFILINAFNILPTPVEKINELTIPNLINTVKTLKNVGARRALSLQKQQQTAPIDEGGTESFAIRRIVWRGAWNMFVANPIFGYGTETFAIGYYRYKPLAQNMVSEWDFLYNKAHNEYLNYLATTGIIGFSTYMSLIIAFIIYFIRSCQKKALNIGLFLAWSTILITNFVGFSVVVISLFFYLIPAIMVVTNEKSAAANHNPLATDNKISFLSLSLISFTFLIALFLIISTFRWWFADIHFARAQSYAAQNNYAAAFDEFQTAIELSPNHPNYHNEFAIMLSEMAQYLHNQNEDKLAKNVANNAIEESNIAVTISPSNPVFYNYRALIFNNLNFVDKKYSKKSISAILKSYELAPTDPKITYHTSIYFLNDGQTKKALRAFEITEKLKPNYIEAISSEAKLLADMDQKTTAVKKLEKLLKYYPGNPNITKLIKSYKE